MKQANPSMAPRAGDGSQRLRDAGRRAHRRGAGPWALEALALLALLAAGAHAADHRESSLTTGDPAADLADVYAWHDDVARRLVTVVTFDGIKTPEAGQRGTFDPDVLYTVNLDNDGDSQPDVQIRTRFVLTPAGGTFVVVQGLPGVAAPVIGPVERVVRRGEARVFAGLRDDPFFFDLEGFRQTLATGTLSFDSHRDTFAGKNATALVFSMDLDAALRGGAQVAIWATTARVSAAQ